MWCYAPYLFYLILPFSSVFTRYTFGKSLEFESLNPDRIKPLSDVFIPDNALSFPSPPKVLSQIRFPNSSILILLTNYILTSFFFDLWES